jgi:hypothetical protein
MPVPAVIEVTPVFVMVGLLPLVTLIPVPAVRVTIPVLVMVMVPDPVALMPAPAVMAVIPCAGVLNPKFPKDCPFGKITR